MYKDPTPRLFSVKFSYQILAGIILGIICGLFFGDKVAFLKVVPPIYIMLVQSVVYPYIICSIIHGLGHISASMAARLFKRSWVFYILLLVFSFIILYVLSIGIPTVISVVVQPGHPSHTVAELLDIIVPQNLFVAMLKNYVPAAVVFSVLFGLALQHQERKETLLDMVAMIRTVSIRIWVWIISAAPIISFAFTAYMAGTIQLTDIYAVGVYIVLYFSGVAILGLVFLPLLFSGLSGISYRKTLSYFRPAMIVAIATTVATSALPLIAQATRSMVADLGMEDDQTAKLTSTTVAISYPFAQVGNLFVYLFLMFAAYNYSHVIYGIETVTLPFMVFLSGLGSTTSSINAVSFLTHWLRLPDLANSLYVELMAITRYGQVFVSVVGISLLTAFIVITYYRGFKLRWKSLIAAVVLLIVFFFGGSVLAKDISKTMHSQRPSLLSFTLEPQLSAGVNVQVLNKTPKASSQRENEDALTRIEHSHVLRVGYNADMVPFVYFNKYGKLVGYDVSYMYALAKTLHAKLLFIPFQWFDLVNDIKANKFDIAIGSIYVTGIRLTEVSFSDPYFRDKPSFFVRNDLVNIFLSHENILQAKNARFAVFNDPVMLPLARLNFPVKQWIIVPNYRDLNKYGVGAAFWTQQHATAMALLHPGYSSVVTRGLKQAMPLMMAFMVNKHSPEFLRFLNYWLALQENDGFAAKQNDYWIKMLPRRSAKSRWSIMHNVLGW